MNMKKKLISCGVVAGALALLITGIPKLMDGSAQAGNLGYNGTSINYGTKLAKTDSTYDEKLGTSENPYLIMELVPYEDMASIGYLVSNQGYVKESALAAQLASSSNDASAIYKRLFESTTRTTSEDIKTGNYYGGTDTVSQSNYQSLKYFASDLDDVSGKTAKQNSGLLPTYAQYGYFERVADGTGRYDLTKAEDGTYTFSKNASNAGNYNWVSLGEFNKSNITDSTQKKDTQFVFSRSVKSFQKDDEGYFYNKNGVKTYYDIYSGEEYTTVEGQPGVHAYSDNNYTDRNGNALTFGTDGKYTGTYGTYTEYVDAQGWPYYNFPSDDQPGCQIRIKKDENGAFNLYYLNSDVANDADTSYEFPLTLYTNDDTSVPVRGWYCFTVSQNGTDTTVYIDPADGSLHTWDGTSTTTSSYTLAENIGTNTVTKDIKNVNEGTSNPNWFTSSDATLGYDAFRTYNASIDSNSSVYDYSWYSTSTDVSRAIKYSNTDVLDKMNAGTIHAPASGAESADSDRYYTVRFDENYYETYQYLITNNNSLARKILGDPNAVVNVVPVTPAILNSVSATNAENFINAADMIIVHDMLDARLMKDSNDYKRDLVPDGYHLVGNYTENGKTFTVDIQGKSNNYPNADAGYHYYLAKLGSNGTLTINNTTRSRTTGFFGDDAAGLLESAVKNATGSLVNFISSANIGSDGTYLTRSSLLGYTGITPTSNSISKKDIDTQVTADKISTNGVQRGYFTYDNDISTNVLNLLVKRQASGDPAAMVLDSSAIYKDSMTTLSGEADPVSNYHDGVPAAVGFEIIPSENSVSDVNCSNTNAHKDLHSKTQNQVKTRKFHFKFTNNSFSKSISPNQLTIFLPKGIFFDEYANQGYRSTFSAWSNTVIGDYDVVTLSVRNKKDKEAGELYLCSSFEDGELLKNFDISKCPILLTVTDGEKEYDVMANQDVAENLNELYVIMNYYGAKYYYNIFCAKRNEKGKITSANIPTTSGLPNWLDPSIAGIDDDSNLEHSCPTADEIKTALVPLTKSTTAYDYTNGTHLTQGSYGNGVGKSQFVWDFDGNRSAFTTAFNMSNYTTVDNVSKAPLNATDASGAAQNASNVSGTASNIAKAVSLGVSNDEAAQSDAVTVENIKNGSQLQASTTDEGITRPAYMDDTTNTLIDDTNLDEVFDQRFAKDADGNVLATDATAMADGKTAALQTSITRADMLAFIDKESNGYNGTTGDKYKATLKILEIEPTDDFVYGSYQKTEASDAASKSNGNKYYNSMTIGDVTHKGINLLTNVDWYSNYDAIKNGFVYAGTKQKDVNTTQNTAEHPRYWYDFQNNQHKKLSVGSATNAVDYIKYQRQEWKDWKEYYYSMLPGFIGTDTNLATDVTIETMPVWKFNADNTDINSEYDMVVVGATQNYKNGQLKRIYSNNLSTFYVDNHMNGASRNKIYNYNRWVCYNDPNLESVNTSTALGPDDNVGTPTSHDTYGDPSYALAWTAVGDYIDTKKGNAVYGGPWWIDKENKSRNSGTPYAINGSVTINTSSAYWVGTRFTINPGSTKTITTNGGSDVSQSGTRFEARDFTKKKAELLLDYADRNLLVIDNAAYSNGAVDGKLIDSRSEMYYVANTLYGGKKNIGIASSIKDNKSLFNVRKSSLLEQCGATTVKNTDGTNKNWPVDYYYAQNSSPSKATANAQKVNNKNALIFDVTVDGKKYNDDGSLKQYHINVYADVNNNSIYDGSIVEQRKTLAFSYDDENKNGIYDPGENVPFPENRNLNSGEKLTAVTIYDITDSNSRIEVSSGQHYPYNAIYAGRKYSVQAVLGENFYGAIGYKFEVSQGSDATDNNSSTRYEKTGLTRFNQGGKKIIHILQMNPVANMNTSQPGNTMAFYSMQGFKDEMAKVPDFYVEIDFLNNSGSNGFYDSRANGNRGGWTQGSFCSQDVTLHSYGDSGYSIARGCLNETWPIVTSKNGDYKFTAHDLDDFTLLLENYDMLFLAGRDSAMTSNDPVFIKAVDRYCANGGSVIMSHDMVSSMFNVHSGGYDNRFSAWNRQMMLQIYYFRKLQGQVVKYYTPGKTHYSYNTMSATSDRDKSVIMPLENSFAIFLNYNNASPGQIYNTNGNDVAVANDLRFADEYDIKNSSAYLDQVVDNTLATEDTIPGTRQRNNSSDNNRAIMASRNSAWALRFDKKYPAGWQSADSSKYSDGTEGVAEGEYAKYFSSNVTNNDIYDLEFYVETSHWQNGSEDVNSFGLSSADSRTDLTIRSWGWVNGLETTRIQNVNKGKVSSYPFIISYNETNGLAPVSKTHIQQFRLDLDHTNDPAPKVDGKMANITDDTIVWYDLANSGNQPMYDFAKGDAANNYYIYTKGNITYTGVGHSQVGDGQNEIDLFINTMIASYRPAESAPIIKVTNADASATGTNETTVYFDSTESNGIITFDVMDPTMANITRDYYLKVYEVQADGTERLKAIPSTTNADGTVTFTTDGTTTTNPSEENVLTVDKGNTLGTHVETETDATKARQLGMLQNGGTDTDSSHTIVNKLQSNEYGFTYKVQKGGHYCFQGDVGKKYCIHLCYRNYKMNSSNNNLTFGTFKEVKHYVKLQNLDYFDLY